MTQVFFSQLVASESCAETRPPAASRIERARPDGELRRGRRRTEEVAGVSIAKE